MAADRFAQRKAALGYRSPAQRDGCWNCRHRSADAFTFTDERRIAYDCTLGKFLVVPQGICERYAPAGRNPASGVRQHRALTPTIERANHEQD